MEHDSVADLCDAVSEGGEVGYVTDDETGADSAAVAGWQAGRDESANSWEHQAQTVDSMEHVGVTVAIVDQPDVVMSAPTTASRVPSYDVSGPTSTFGRGGGSPLLSTLRSRLLRLLLRVRTTIRTQGFLSAISW